MGQKERARDKLLKKARWYSDHNRLYKACIHYLNFLREEPGNIQALEELGQLYMDRGDFELGALCFDAILGGDQLRQDVLIRQIRCYFQAGRISEALLLLEMIPEWGEEHLEEVMMARSQCRLSMGFELEAIQIMGDLIRRFPQPPYFMILAEILMAQLQWPAALECCRRGLKRDPYSDELLAAKARCHLELDEYGKARDIYMKMIKNQMPQMEVRMDLEDCLANKGYIPELADILRYFEDFPFTDLQD